MTVSAAMMPSTVVASVPITGCNKDSKQHGAQDKENKPSSSFHSRPTSFRGRSIKRGVYHLFMEFVGDQIYSSIESKCWGGNSAIGHSIAIAMVVARAMVVERGRASARTDRTGKQADQRRQLDGLPKGFQLVDKQPYSLSDLHGQVRLDHLTDKTVYRTDSELLCFRHERQELPLDLGPDYSIDYSIGYSPDYIVAEVHGALPTVRHRARPLLSLETLQPGQKRLSQAAAPDGFGRQ